MRPLCERHWVLVWVVGSAPRRLRARRQGRICWWSGCVVTALCCCHGSRCGVWWWSSNDTTLHRRDSGS